MLRRMIFANSLDQKASLTHRAIGGVYKNRPVWTNANYHNLASEGYRANVYVYSAITQVTRAAKGIGINFYKKNTSTRGGMQKLEYGEGGAGARALMDLFSRPNPRQGWGAFVESVWGFRRISGNSYIEEISPETGPRRGMPLELWPARPDRMKVIGDGGVNGLISGYEYRIGGSDPITFATHEILHWKYFDPLDDFYGLSPIAVASRSVDQSNESAKWNFALLRNGASPSGIFSVPHDLGDDFEEYRDELIDSYTGVENAGAPIFGDNDLDWKQIGMSPADMMWVEARNMSAAEIAISQGVAPELISSGEKKKYSNYGEARKALYLETVLPEWDDFRDELNHWLVPRYGDGLYIDYDRDDIEALKEEREKVYTSVVAAVNAGVMTRRQGAEELGKDTDELGPEADILTVSAGTVPLSIVTGVTATSVSDSSTNGGDTGQPDAPDGSKAVDLYSPEMKELYWRSVEAHRNNYVSTIQNLVMKRFQAEHATLIKAAAGGNTGREAMNRVLHYLSDSENINAWRQLITATWFAVGEDFASRTYNTLIPKKGIKNEDAASQAWRRMIAASLNQNLDDRVGDGRGPQGVTGTTLDDLKRVLAEGVAAGEGADLIAQRVDSLYLESIIPNRSEVIARTEVISASNLGTRSGALSTGLSLRKTWIGTFDARIRDSHQTAAETYNDAGAIDINDAYVVGGSSLMYPGDPSGDAKEVINCRCVEGYITN